MMETDMLHPFDAVSQILVNDGWVMYPDLPEYLDEPDAPVSGARFIKNQTLVYMERKNDQVNIGTFINSGKKFSSRYIKDVNRILDVINNIHSFIQSASDEILKVLPDGFKVRRNLKTMELSFEKRDGDSFCKVIAHSIMYACLTDQISGRIIWHFKAEMDHAGEKAECRASVGMYKHTDAHHAGAVVLERFRPKIDDFFDNPKAFVNTNHG